jgi:UDP-2,4-diacetamido-2,4,6-trideoxy-beta-L-altropyranose hydrolase
MIPRPLLMRADANVAIGTGHIMRCLALAQAWSDAGGRAVFVMAEATAAIERRLREESCDVVCPSARPGTEEDGRLTIRLARQHEADWVVVDGYQFGSDYQRNLKAAGFKVLFVDDYGHAQRYFADIVLNQNVGADEQLYRDREPYTQLLLGTRFCLLRREFEAWRDWKRDIPKAGRRVLVTMGGSDPENVTGRVIQALRLVQHRDLTATVVVGGSNPHFEALQRAACPKAITLLKGVSNMAELMAEADVAISAAGSTCWELCQLGLPALLIDVAENQKAVARELRRLGCAIHLGDLEDVTSAKIASQLEILLESQELRRTLSQRSREMVDGAGVQRVVSILCGGSGALTLRPAREDDARMLWEWANDPEVRAASFSSAFIPWEAHVAWFAEKRRSDRCLILIAEDGEDIPIGQIRFDTGSDGEREVDLSIARVQRGQGLGSQLIRLGILWLSKKKSSARIHAFVRPENQASVKAFEKAEFKRTGIEQVRGNEAIHLVYEEN